MTVSYGHIPSLIPRSNGGSAEITAKSDRRPPLSRICTSSSPWIAVATNGCCIVWPEFEAFQLLWFWIIILFDRNWDNLNEDVIIPVLFYGNGLVRLQRSRLAPTTLRKLEEWKRFQGTAHLHLYFLLSNWIYQGFRVPTPITHPIWCCSQIDQILQIWDWQQLFGPGVMTMGGGGLLFCSAEHFLGGWRWWSNFRLNPPCPPTPTPPHRQKTVGRARYGAENQALLTQAEQTEPYMGLSWVCGTDPANSQNHLSKQGRILGASSSSLSQGEKRSIS